jgi:hypothetical protein
VNGYLALFFVCSAGFAIFAALRWSGIFETGVDLSDRNPWSDKRVNIKRGIVSRGVDYDDGAENFNLSKDDDVALGSLRKYPSKMKEPWELENKK